MGIKDKLLKQKKGNLSVVKTSNVPVKKSSELDKLTYEIKANLSELEDIVETFRTKKIRAQELKQTITEQLIYIRDNKKKLLPDRTLEDYLINDLGISKGYFYQEIRAYELALEYNKPDLYKEVDSKILASISSEKDIKKQKLLIVNAHKLTRDSFKKQITYKDKEIEIKDDFNFTCPRCGHKWN